MTLPVFRDRPNEVAEELIGDCGPSDPLTPVEIAKLEKLVNSGRDRRDERPPTGERCRAPSYSLRPAEEIPAEQHAGQPASTQHLTDARSAYEAARALDPSNLRTHVALAFIYDRANMKVQAADELRDVLRQGLKRIPPPADGAYADWETHVVVSEALVALHPPLCVTG